MSNTLEVKAKLLNDLEMEEKERRGKVSNTKGKPLQKKKDMISNRNLNNDKGNKSYSNIVKGKQKERKANSKQKQNNSRKHSKDRLASNPETGEKK